MKKKDRIVVLEGEVQTLQGRMDALEGLDAKEMTEAVRDALDGSLASRPEDQAEPVVQGTDSGPSLWWFEDQFWVRDGVPRLVERGEAYVRTAPALAVCAWGDKLGEVQPLRPAKTFDLNETHPALVESGEVRLARANEWWYDPEYARGGNRPQLSSCGHSTSPSRILISVEEAKCRCGVEDERAAIDWRDRAERAEARAKGLRGELDLSRQETKGLFRQRLGLERDLREATEHADRYPASPEAVEALVRAARLAERCRADRPGACQSCERLLGEALEPFREVGQ